MTWVAHAAGALAVVVASTAQAQLARRPAGAPSAQGAAASPGGWTAYGGLATGDGALDMGFAGQASYRTRPGGWPFDLRIDPYLAIHSGDQSFGSFSSNLTLLLLGAQANAAYTFPNAARSAEWFIFGGLGIFYANYSYGDNVPGGFEGSASDTNLGLGFGGGVNFGGNWVVEGQVKMIDEFTTIPILLGWRFR